MLQNVRESIKLTQYPSRKNHSGSKPWFRGNSIAQSLTNFTTSRAIDVL